MTSRAPCVPKREAVQEALRRHKLAGNPVAVWRDARVEWIQPEDIPDQPESPGLSVAERRRSRVRSDCAGIEA